MYSMHRDYMSRHEQSEIIVRGTAEEFAFPNMAIVSAKVLTTDTDPLGVELLNNKSLDQVLEWLIQYGVQAKDIIIEKGIVIPITDEEGNIVSHQVSSYIAVTFYDLITIREFIKNIKVEDIEIIEIVVTLNNLDKLYDISLKKAMLRVYDKAKIISESMNVRLIPTPLTLKEISNQDEILIEITQTAQELKDIRYIRLVIPTSVEAKFLVEEFQQ